MSEIEAIINDLLNEEQNIFGVAIISKDGNLLTQTENILCQLFLNIKWKSNTTLWYRDLLFS